MENTFYRQQRAVFPIPMLSMFFPDAMVVDVITVWWPGRCCLSEMKYCGGIEPGTLTQL